MAADLVVVNHHLFFADMALRDSGVAELLPTVDAAVFDEAHQLVEAGVQFLGTTLATGQAIDLGRDMLARRPVAGPRPAALERRCRRHRARRARVCGWLAPARCARCAAWSSGAGRSAATPPGRPCRRWPTARLAAAAALAEWPRRRPTSRSCEQRARELAQLAARFVDEAAVDHVRWIDLTPQQARLVESPLDIREMLTEQRQLAPRAWIFTSATLGDDEALSWFTASTGLEDAARLRVGSPFDYAAHARVWVPASLPQPNAAGPCRAPWVPWRRGAPAPSAAARSC